MPREAGNGVGSRGSGACRPCRADGLHRTGRVVFSLPAQGDRAATHGGGGRVRRPALPVSYTHLDVYKRQVVAINGPRQSGKTTLLKSAFPEYQYVSLENPDVRLIAESDPNSFLNDYPEKVIFDEVQRVPPVSYTHLDVYKRQSFVIFPLMLRSAEQETPIPTGQDAA